MKNKNLKPIRFLIAISLLATICFWNSSKADTTTTTGLNVTVSPSTGPFGIEEVNSGETITIDWIYYGASSGGNFAITTTSYSDYDEIEDEYTLYSDSYSGNAPSSVFELKLLDLAEMKNLDPDTSNTEQSVSIYIVVKAKRDYPLSGYTSTSEDQNYINDSEQISIDLDFEPPATPTIQVAPGEESLHITYEVSDDDNEAEYLYNIYYREAGSDDAGAGEWVLAKEKTSANEYHLTGLKNFVTYEVRVNAVDDADNAGAFSDIVSGTPVPVFDYFEFYADKGGKEDGGYCFIATAAYGDYNDNTVRSLREFRDKVLMQSQFGRSLVRTYYRFSPALAEMIRGNDSARRATRILLKPVALISELIVWNPFAFSLGAVFLVGAFGVALLRLKPKSNKPAKTDKKD